MQKKLLLIFPLVTALFFLTRCAPVAIVGGGAVATSYVIRDKQTGDSVSDSVISAKVKASIYKSVGADIDALVDINVHEKEVLLTGAVGEEQAKISVEEAVWRVKGVRKVYNDIEVSDVEPIKTYHKDAWITSKIKTKLLAIPSIRSVNYSIKTVNQVVYIMGIARTTEELEKVLDITSRIKNVNRVVSYVRLREEKN